MIRSGLPALAGLLAFTCAIADVRLPQAGGGELLLDEPARRVITLAPHLAELVWEAGAGDRLVATVAYSGFPEAVARLPEIGDAFRFDLEQILQLEPDLIVAWDSGNPEPALASLDGLGLPVWRTEIRRPEEIAEVITLMGAATGRGDSADRAAAAFSERLRSLRSAHADSAAVSYFYQVSERPLYTVTGDHLISRGLAICGARNVFADLGALAPQVSPEAVLEADPQVLFAGAYEGSGEALDHWRQWPRMRAVQRDAIHYLPADEINRATPRLLDAIERACKLLAGFRATTQKQRGPE